MKIYPAPSPQQVRLAHVLSHYFPPVGPFCGALFGPARSASAYLMPSG